MNVSAHPLVSVIVPVYNVETYLDCCLQSIRDQTWTRLEIIVVEDGSTDGSLARLQPHLADPRVRLVQHPRNAGLSAARNSGIEAAGGDYVLCVDSDDALAPTLIEACVAAAGAHDADVVVFGFEPFQDGRPLPALPVAGQGAAAVRALAPERYFALPHFAWLKFFRRELLEVHPQLRFPVGLCYEDWPFHWELGLVARRMVELDGGWYAYRQRPASISASSGRKLLDQFAVQDLVLDRLAAHASQAGARALADKVHESFWTVLTRIDAPLLPEALARARRVRHRLAGVAGAPPARGRGAVMARILALPSPAAAAAVWLLRLAKRGAAPLRHAQPVREAAT